MQRALLARRSPPGSARKIVGQVYDGGAMPTTVPAWFFTHPADFACNEVEGGACSPAIDGTNTVPILVLGPDVPSVGDLLPARMIGGKWVAGSGESSPPTFCCGCNCSPCQIPLGSITLLPTNPPFSPQPLGVGCNATLSTCVDDLSGNTNVIRSFSSNCNSGTWSFTLVGASSGSCGAPAGGFVWSTNCTGQPAPCFQYALTSSSCSNPFQLTFTNSVGGILKFGSSSTVPAYTNPPGLMCQIFAIDACGACPLGAVTVSVFDHVGGTLLASGTLSGGTTTAGSVQLFWQGTPGSFYVTVTAPSGFTPFADTVALSCNDTTAITLDPTTTISTVTDSTFFPGGLAVTQVDDLDTVFPGAGLAGVLGWYATSTLTSPACTVGTNLCAGTTFSVGYVLMCSQLSSFGFSMGVLARCCTGTCYDETSDWQFVAGPGTAAGLRVTNATCSPFLAVGVVTSPISFTVFPELYFPCGSTGTPKKTLPTITWTP